MWPYVLLIALPIISQYVGISRSKLCIYLNNKRKNYKSMQIFWALLLIMLCLRHEVVGIDLEVYDYIFKFISKSDWADALGRSEEIGYSFLNKIVSLFTNDFRWIIVITAILSVYFIGKAYTKYSKDTSLTIALFLCTSNFILLFSGLRQSIAISIGFLAFEFVKRKKLIAFIVTVFIAILFHTSAFMILIMYPLYYMKINKKTLFVVVPLLGILMIFKAQVFRYLTIILSMFTDYEAGSSSTGAYSMLILFIVFAIFSYLIPEESELDNDTKAMRNFLILSVALQIFASLHNLAMRMNYYFIAFIPIIIPRIIECRSKKWNQVAVLAKYIMLIFFIGYFFMTAPTDNSLRTFPYQFFWEMT